MQHARALPDRQLDARPVFDRILKHRLGSAEAAPGVQQTIDLRSVPCPFDFADRALRHHGCSCGVAASGSGAPARCASEEPYQRLQIGTEAKAAYESAKRERDEALALHREAEKVLDDAKAKAATLVAEAEAIKADVEKTRADADELHQRYEQQLHDAQDKVRKALVSAQALPPGHYRSRSEGKNISGQDRPTAGSAH
jgi:hypothetical protein